jgi:hypothetical protein
MYASLRGTSTLVVAVVIGFGIPIAWVWIAGAMQSASDSQGLAFAAALTALGGIVASYVAVIAAMGMVTGWRMNRRGEAPPVRRYNWNRSMRDERHSAPALSGLETLFVVTTLLVGGAYMLWFFAFAGSSLPSGV